MDKKLEKDKKEYFPLFVATNNKKVLVVGGGKIAERRIKTLMKFKFLIRVIAIDVTGILQELSAAKKIELVQRAFTENDIDNEYDYLIVATDNREVNHNIYTLAKARGIFVNVADCKEECDFFFPGVVTHEEAVIGVTCGGESHATAKAVTDKIRDLFENN